MNTQVIHNWDEALERLGGDRDFLIELLSDFTAMLPESLDKIDQALEQKQAKILAEAAHTLKGVARNLSLIKLGEVSQKIEEAAKGEAWNSVQSWVDALHLAHDEYQAYYKGVKL